MEVLALIESADHVCYRYRLNALAWALAQEGLLLEALPIQRGWRRISSLLAGRGAKIVVLQRKLLPAWQLAILRRNAQCLVYDIDDAVFRRPTFTRPKQRSHARLTRFRGIVRAADAVLAGNDYLAQFASAYTEPGRVHFVPTCVEPSWYPLASHRRIDSWARLAWIGQRSMLPSLNAMQDHLAAIGRRLPDVSLRVICDVLPQVSGLQVELRPWSSSTEAAELADADIGVSWLCDDLWGQGKCGLKILQYMAAGLPVVANSVGVHRKMIVHGQSGFLVDTPDDWAESVARLAANPSLRHRMGAAARLTVENDYNVRCWGPKVARLLRQLADEQSSNGQPLGNRECNDVPWLTGEKASH
jgi:glycosyltransferase involved in cell wall biosynthesis